MTNQKRNLEEDQLKFKQLSLNDAMSHTLQYTTMAGLEAINRAISAEDKIKSLQQENEQMRYCLDNIANRPIGVFGEGFGYDFHYENVRKSAKKCLDYILNKV
jgi:hypothetical protein